MTSKQKIKGNKLERDIVKDLNKFFNFYIPGALEAGRTWGSNGLSCGMTEQTDVYIENTNSNYCITMQTKSYSKKTVPAGFLSFYKKLVDQVDVGLVKVTGSKLKDSMVVMDYGTFKRLLISCPTFEISDIDDLMKQLNDGEGE